MPLPLSGSRGRMTSRTKEKDWNESDNDSDTEKAEDDSSTAGLGINFYDHRGNSRRSIIVPRTSNGTSPVILTEHKEGGEKEEAREGLTDESSGYEALAVLSQQAKTNTTNGRTPKAQQSQQQLRTKIQQQIPQQSPSFTSSTCSSKELELALQTPKLLAPLVDPDWDHDSPIDLIEEYLEKHYRDQAETFVRIASREIPVRALSGGRAVSCSRRDPSAHLSALGLGTASTVETPSTVGGRAVSVSSSSNDETDIDISSILHEDANEDKSINLGDSPTFCELRHVQQSPPTVTQARNTSTGNTSSPPIPFKPPSRVQEAIRKLSNQHGGTNTSNSGFSPLVSISSPSVTTATTPSTSTPTLKSRGTAIARIPLHSKPTILKRGSRPTSSSTAISTSTATRTSQPVRGPEYFTNEERHKIATLVFSTERNCEKHTNCKDCIDLEFAYYENKFLPRNMDPEQRQKIINNNRSLRNIKNVRLLILLVSWKLNSSWGIAG